MAARYSASCHGVDPGSDPGTAQPQPPSSAGGVPSFPVAVFPAIGGCPPVPGAPPVTGVPPVAIAPPVAGTPPVAGPVPDIPAIAPP